MRIYLDESLANATLARFLTHVGHDVQSHTDVGLLGADHAEHLTQAIRDERVCMSRQSIAYENLHKLIGAAQGQHAGILIVRRYNDPTRDLTFRGMVRAIGNLEAAGFPMGDQFEVLNRWH